MKNIRKGNDIQIAWSIYTTNDGNREPYILEGKNLALTLLTPFNKEKVVDFIVDGNTITFTYFGKHQRTAGRYSLLLIENEGMEGMHTVDKCDAFGIVNHTCEVGGEDDSNIELVSLEFDSDIDTGSGAIAQSMVNVTYSELVALRDYGRLVAGTFYRITDYETTTSQFGTLSAGHPFDVVVLALTETALADEAYVVHSERDTDGYFANSNLSAWKIWYCLDNDTTKFAWAALPVPDTNTYKLSIDGVTENVVVKRATNVGGIDWYVMEHTKKRVFCKTSVPDANTIFYDAIFGKEVDAVLTYDSISVGKGIIYRMIDEFNNDIPYDFKNIMYEDKKGFGYVQWGVNYTFVRNESLDKKIGGVQYYGYTSDVKPNAWSSGNCLITDETPTKTSVMYNEDGSTISYGGNIVSVYLEEKVYYTFANHSYNTTIRPYRKNGRLTLNKIVFGNDCHDNTFGNNCENVTFNYDGEHASCSYCVIHSNVKNVVIECTDFGAITSIRYIHVYSGIENTTLEVGADRNYVTTFAKNSSGKVVEFCLADR